MGHAAIRLPVSRMAPKMPTMRCKSRAGWSTVLHSESEEWPGPARERPLTIRRLPEMLSKTQTPPRPPPLAEHEIKETLRVPRHESRGSYQPWALVHTLPCERSTRRNRSGVTLLCSPRGPGEGREHRRRTQYPGFCRRRLSVGHAAQHLRERSRPGCATSPTEGKRAAEAQDGQRGAIPAPKDQ